MDEPGIIREQRQQQRPSGCYHPGSGRIPGNQPRIIDSNTAPSNSGARNANSTPGDSASNASTPDTTALRTIERIADQSDADAHTEADSASNAKTKTHPNTNSQADSETNTETDSEVDTEAHGDPQTVA
jgi:hypothetical protein